MEVVKRYENDHIKVKCFNLLMTFTMIKYS